MNWIQDHRHPPCPRCPSHPPVSIVFLQLEYHEEVWPHNSFHGVEGHLMLCPGCEGATL